jgi:type I restriction enzyme M protein
MALSEILRDFDYRHTQFDLALIHEFERKRSTRTDKNGKEIPYINCAIREKGIRLTPEEAVRQLYLENILYK